MGDGVFRPSSELERDGAGMLCTRSMLGDPAVAAGVDESAAGSSNVACSMFRDEDLATILFSAAKEGRRGDTAGLDRAGVASL